MLIATFFPSFVSALGSENDSSSSEVFVTCDSTCTLQQETANWGKKCEGLDQNSGDIIWSRILDCKPTGPFDCSPCEPDIINRPNFASYYSSKNGVRIANKGGQFCGFKGFEKILNVPECKIFSNIIDVCNAVRARDPSCIR
ncbi:MAG: hypothetical protein NT027_19550 [Proteobacteria bacterium]|nr:hypothetical protein [Pseudomonadota bacterium]